MRINKDYLTIKYYILLLNRQKYRKSKLKGINLFIDLYYFNITRIKLFIPRNYNNNQQP